MYALVCSESGAETYRREVYTAPPTSPPFTPKKGVYLDPYLIVVYIIFNYVLT